MNIIKIKEEDNGNKLINRINELEEMLYNAEI